MMTATNTRSQARKSLTNKWGKGALISLAYVFISYLLNYISARFVASSLESIIGIIISLVEIPLSFGLLISFIRLKRNEDVKAFDFFNNFSNNFKRGIGITWNTFLKMIVPFILIIIGGFLLGVSMSLSVTSILFSSTNSSYITLTIIGAILLIVGGIYGIIKGLLYSLSYYIAYDNPEMTTKEAVEKSAELMNGNRGNIFVLELSFIGWAILATFTLGIGFLWLIPYVQVALICFYEEVSGIESNINVIDNTEDNKTEE